MHGVPPPPRATTTPPPPPQGAHLPPRPSPRATLPLPPSSPAAAALRPGAQVFVPFAGDEQTQEFPLPRNREAQETRGRSPKDATESTKRKESKVKQRKEKPAKQKGQRAPLQLVTEMNSGELPPPLPPSPPSVLVPEFPLPSREEQETRGGSNVDAIESTPVGTTTTTLTRKHKVSSLSAKQKDSRVQQRKEKPAKPLPQRPPVARPPPQPTSYSPDPKTAMAGQPHTLSPLEGAAEDTSISIGTDRGYAGASSDVYLSGTKRKESGEKQRNEPQAKRLRSPAGLVSPRLISPSIGIRIMLSPRLISPSTTLANSTPGKRRRNLRGSPHLIKRRKLRSEIWEDFEPIYDGEIVAEARCLHCHKLFKVYRDVGTSACLRHMRSCEGKTKMNQMLDQMNSGNMPLPENWKFDPVVSRQELVKLIVVHSLPFSLVEYPKFRSFVSSLNPWFNHVSRMTIKENCVETYEWGKKKLHNFLNGLSSRVSLTADLWTSKQTLGYLCVTCHFITDCWSINKKIINFALIETPHDGRNIFSAMLKCLNEWNLEHKVFSITLDNASNNNSFVSYLKENLVAKCLLLSQGNLLHYRCAAHVFNLIVQEGLQEASNIVSNIRDSVKYVKSSQGRKERFEKVIKEVRISTKKRPPLDVVTRWNSTYHMLKCASEYERAFEALAQEDTQYVHLPHISKWIMAQKLCNILDKFADATKILSGYKYPTTSIYFHQIWDIKLLLEEELSNKDAMVRFMVHEMRKKIQKYWDLSFLQICVPVVLDPRFKLGFLEFRLPKIGGDYSSSTYFPQVKQTFKDLYDEYFLKWGHLVPEYAKPAADEPNFGKNNPWADWGQHQNLNQRRRVSELDKYLEEETVPVDIEFDILEYWKMSSATYPVLARMARDILAIPASTVASESAFSSGEKIINEYRSRLTSDTVEALVCLQDWLRGSTSPDDIAGCIMGDEEDDEL